MILTLPLLFFTGTFSPGHLPPPLLVSSANMRLDITEAVEAEISNFDTLFETWVATYRAAEDDAGREAALENRPTADDAVKNLFGLVETEPAGDGAFKALTWIMRAYTSEGMSPSAQALSLLAEHHIESEQLEDVAMNTVCAAGTGSFLDQQAARVDVAIEEDFGRLACLSEHPPRIAGRCQIAR